MGGATPRSCLAWHLEDDRVAAPAAGADRGHTDTAATAAQFLDQAEDDPGAASANGVAESDRATIHIDAIGVDTKPPTRDDWNTGECLVDFPDIDIRRLEPGPAKCLLRGHGGRVGEIGNVPGGLAMRQD